MAGRELMYVLEERIRSWSRYEREVVIKHLLIYFRCNGRVLEDGFDFRSEDEPAVFMKIVKRLDTDSVAREHELLSRTVPDCYRKVTFNVIYDINSLLFIEMDDRLAISFGSVDVTPLDQSLSKIQMVVDLAIENNPMRIVAAVHWLVTGCGKIDDGKPSETEATSLLIKEEIAGVVWTTMRHFIAHAIEQGGLNLPLSCSVFPDSTNAAHEES
jgi:hypothetical protein